MQFAPTHRASSLQRGLALAKPRRRRSMLGEPHGKHCELLLNPYRFGGGFKCDGARFTKGTDMLYKLGAFSGAADSKTGIMSYWVNLPDVDPEEFFGTSVFRSYGNSITESFFWSTLSVKAGGSAWDFNSIATGQGPLGTAFTLIADSENRVYDNWVHVLVAWDSSTGDLSKTFVYVNGVDLLDSVSSSVNDFDSVLWAGSNFYSLAVGGSRTPTSGGTNLPTGVELELAEVYLAPGQWLDLSDEGNREKFRTAAGKPADLGSDGSRPTGAAPMVYLHLDPNEDPENFAINRAGNGDFSIVGTLTSATTRPTD